MSRRLMSMVSAVVISTTATLAVPLVLPFLSTPAAAGPPPGCSKVVAYSTVTPQQTADGAQQQWVFRQKVASDYAPPPAGGNGFAAQALFVATDNKPISTTWVEVGDTQGWEGSNIWTGYTASGVDYPTTGHYYEARLYITPSVGTSATWQVIPAAASGYYLGQVIYQGTTRSVSWQNHHPNSTQYWGGLEVTCQTNRVDRTYVYTNQFRRASDHVFVTTSNGSLYHLSPAFIGWCTQPVTYRDYINNQIGDGCG